MLEGEKIDIFERRFADYIGVRHAIAVSSGKIALYLCLKALGAKEDDGIILPSYTVPEVVIMVLYTGTRPTFIDIHPETYNMNAGLIEKRITEKTRFILLTHIYGQPCDIDPILDIAKRYNLKVIEDCAQACGAEYKGRKVGSFGDLSYFSFALMKNLNTLGGSMITTDDAFLAAQIREEIKNFDYPKRTSLMRRLFLASALSLFTHPIIFSLFVYPFIYLLSLIENRILYNLLRNRKPIDLMRITSLEKHKLKFTNLQALIGLEQLESIDNNNDWRINNANILSTLLKETNMKIPQTLPYVKNIYLNYVIRVKDRESVIKKLLRRGIDVTAGYIESCSSLKEFREFKASSPESDTLSQDNLYLPIQPPLNRKHMHYIYRSLKEIYLD